MPCPYSFNRTIDLYDVGLKQLHPSNTQLSLKIVSIQCKIQCLTECLLLFTIQFTWYKEVLVQFTGCKPAWFWRILRTVRGKSKQPAECSCVNIECFHTYCVKIELKIHKILPIWTPNLIKQSWLATCFQAKRYYIVRHFPFKYYKNFKL